MIGRVCNCGEDNMTLQRTLFMLASFATAICALIAAWYWYRSSRPAPPPSLEIFASIDDAPAQYVLDARVAIDSIQVVLAETSRLNKLASIWSAFAAVCGAASAFLSM
jgi:hypothetical protein